MEYQLTADVTPPSDTPALDALQRHGVAALLDEHLELLAEIEGPDGVEIEPVDHRISVHPGGASITWVLDAPALVFAEDAARQVLGELLERTELLTDWTVRRCEVTASDEELAAALAGSGDTDEADVEIEFELADLDTVPEQGDPGEERRARLVDAAADLMAFGQEAFGCAADDPDDPEVTVAAAELVAGALMVAVDVLTEELFADIQALDDAGTSAAEQEVLWVLHELPTRYAGHYTALFAKRFLVAVAVLGYRLTQPGWDGPRSIAEALAIRLLEATAREQLELAGVLDDIPLDTVFETFDEYAFAGVDVEPFFQDADDADEAADDEAESEDEADVDELVLVEWFEPLDVVDADEEEDAEVDETVQA